jgi:type II secretory pathway pseudopilin PulG
MTLRTDPARQNGTETNSEAGFMLVFMVLLAALLLIALAVAAPIMAKQLQRDKEVESEHRAEQYVRAIRLYYRKFKTYPPSIDALQNTNNVRFLRKQYIDPLTGKADWRIIHVGENKTTVKGFFGQPLGGLDTTGVGGGLGSAAGLASGSGPASAGAAGTAGAPGTSTPSSTVSGGSALSAGFTGATIGGSTTAGSPGAAGSPIGSTDSSTIGGSSTGGPIMGVGTSKTGASIADPNEQTTYETWEFLYDPKIELLYQKANLFGGAASSGGLSSTPAGSFGSNAATGQSNAQSNTPGGAASTPSTPQTGTIP